MSVIFDRARLVLASEGKNAQKGGYNAQEIKDYLISLPNSDKKAIKATKRDGLDELLKVSLKNLRPGSPISVPVVPAVPVVARPQSPIRRNLPVSPRNTLNTCVFCESKNANNATCPLNFLHNNVISRNALDFTAHSNIGKQEYEEQEFEFYKQFWSYLGSEYTYDEVNDFLNNNDDVKEKFSEDQEDSFNFFIDFVYGSCAVKFFDASPLSVKALKILNHWKLVGDSYENGTSAGAIKAGIVYMQNNYN